MSDDPRDWKKVWFDFNHEAQPYYGIAKLALENGDIDKAEMYFDKFEKAWSGVSSVTIKNESESPTDEVRREILNAMARIAMEEGDYDRVYPHDDEEEPPNPDGQLQLAYSRIATLEAAIRKHRDERGNDRCWQDDEELYGVLGGPQPDTSLPPKEEFLTKCKVYCERFWESRQAPRAQEGTK